MVGLTYLGEKSWNTHISKAWHTCQIRYNDQLTLYYKEDTDYWRHFQKREALGFEDVSSGPQTKVVFNFPPSKINWTKMVFTPHMNIRRKVTIMNV